MPNTNKTVKITNGKILNYKISAPNYKTIYGSQLITADTTINRNMIAEVDPNGVYSLGDRIGDIASFVCYFNSTNPETNVNTKYAVFVLDAKYRGLAQLGGANAYQNLMPRYYFTDIATALTRKESATWNTDTIINGAPTYSETCPAFTLCRQVSININGQIYQGQLPNMYELYQIRANKETLDTFDPTLSDYPNNSLSDWNMGSTSNYTYVLQSQYEIPNNNPANIELLTKTGTTYTALTSDWGVVPVFEIPVE